MKIAAVKAPAYGEERRHILEDLALVTGATFISNDSGIRLKDVKLHHLGTARRVEIGKRHSTFADGQTDYDELQKRIETLHAELLEEDDLALADRIQERVVRLSSGIAILRVGGATEIEVTEKKHRIEDALEAEVPWYYPIDSWDMYCSFLGSKDRKELARPGPHILKYREYNRIGYEPDD